MTDPKLGINLAEIVESYLENDSGEQVLAILESFILPYSADDTGENVPEALRRFMLQNALLLGDVYHHVGYDQAAIRYYMMAVGWLRSWGEEAEALAGHVASALTRLALSLVHMHDLVLAREFIEISRSSFRRVPGSHLPDKVVFLFVSALLHQADGKTMRQATSLRKATSMLRQLGPLAVHTVWELRSLGLSVLRAAQSSEVGEMETKTDLTNASEVKRDSVGDQLQESLRLLQRRTPSAIPDDAAEMVGGFGTVTLPNNLRPALFQGRLDDARALHGPMHEEFGTLLLRALSWYRSQAIGSGLDGRALSWREACNRFANIETSVVHDPAWPSTQIHLKSAALNIFLGDFDAALRHILQVVTIENRWIEKVVPTQSTEHRRGLLRMVRATSGLLVSLILQRFRDDKKVIQLAFDVLVRRRGVDLEARRMVRELIHGSSCAEVAENYEELSGLNEEIAGYAYQGLVGTEGVSGLRMVENSMTRAKHEHPNAIFTNYQSDVFRTAYMVALKANLETAPAPDQSRRNSWPASTEVFTGEKVARYRRTNSEAVAPEIMSR